MKKVKEKKEANPDVKRFVCWFLDEYKRRFKRTYFFTGKDGMLIKRLLNTFSYWELVNLLDEFFRSTDPFIQRAGYTVGVFSSQINKLNSARRDNVLSDKGMATLQAGKAWIDEGENDGN